MNNKVEIFNHKEFGKVRTLIIDGQPWFAGIDVASILGYSNQRDAVNKHVDEDDKRIIQKSQFATLEMSNRGLTIINESGLYSLILRSNLDSAKRFKKWITANVLPSIRQNGMYMAGVENDEIDEEKLILAKANLILNSRYNRAMDLLEHKERVIKEKDKVIEETHKEMEEKDMFINQIAVSKNAIKIRDLAQLCCKNGINIGQNRLFEQLRIWGLLCRSDNSPYQRYLDMGLFEVVEFPIETTRGVEIKRSLRVTGKGQEYIVIRLLKDRMREKLG